MAKKIDQTGKKYGKLTVLEQILDKEIKRQHGGAACWRCVCQCGRQTIATGHQLRRGRRKTCGFPECSNNIKNEIGNRYTKLTVIKYAGLKKGQVLWECQCDCGNITEVLGINLRNGNTKSCGCLKSQGEFKIAQLLLEHNIPFEKEKSFETCFFDKTGYLAKFDFYINNKYIVEFDGIQHFKYDSNSCWNNKENLEKTQYRDKIKNEWCKQNNIPIIRIPYFHLKDLIIEDLLLQTSSFIFT